MQRIKNLEKSILSLITVLKSSGLSGQEDKEIRAEIVVLERELYNEYCKQGISMYGSYFDVETDNKN